VSNILIFSVDRKIELWFHVCFPVYVSRFHCLEDRFVQPFYNRYYKFKTIIFYFLFSSPASVRSNSVRFGLLLALIVLLTEGKRTC
jgi:hypothetical protein